MLLTVLILCRFVVYTTSASCFKVFPCSLSSCFVIPFSIVITSLGEEGAGLCAYRAFVCLFVLYGLVFVIFLFLLVSGCRGLAVVCDCDTPWTFLLTFLFLFCVALWFILRGASCLVLLCSSFSCFSPFRIMITSLGEERAGLCASRAFVCLLCTRYFFPFSLPLGVRGWCGVWLWHSLDFSINFIDSIIKGQLQI